MPQNENTSRQLESHQPNLGPAGYGSLNQKARPTGAKSRAENKPDCLRELISLKME